MRISFESFQKVFVSRFWKKLDESIVPYSTSIPNKSNFLKELYEAISDYSYSPSRPREYIYIRKDRGAVRFVPTFEKRDYCTYFFCIKMLEEEIAVNRVPNTFGGWTLGNKIRLQEEAEGCELDYAPPNSFDSTMWVKQWGSFQDVIKAAKNKIEWSYCVSFDIANFYDNISLTALERKLRHAIPAKKHDVVNLLMQFLFNWNREIEGYGTKSVGLPQDEIGDCSRILANFYLQDYDLFMKGMAEKHGCLYTRYADDQIVFAKSQEAARRMVFEASMGLFRLNLSLNASKIREFNSVKAFEDYWCFDIFSQLENPSVDDLNFVCKSYFDMLGTGTPFRQASVLKRLLKFDCKKLRRDLKHRLIAHLHEEPQVVCCNQFYLGRFRDLIDHDQEFFNFLDDFSNQCIFNSFHYNVKAYYKKNRVAHDLTPLRSLIAAIQKGRLKQMTFETSY